MGRYDRHAHRAAEERPWRVHPVWRGIGCVLIIILPMMAYAGAVELVKANLEYAWIAIPRELVVTVTIPFVNLAVPYLYANLAVGFLLLILGYGVLIIFYTAFYRIAGPPRLGPMDAPPPKRPRKRRRR